MQAVRALLARASLARASSFHRRKWTESCHTLNFSTKYIPCSRVVLSTRRNPDVLSTQVRPSSSLPALFRRKKAARVEVTDGTAPTWVGDTGKSIEVSVSAFLYRSLQREV